MSRLSTTLSTDPTPTPPPASEERSIADLVEEAGSFAHCRSIDELPADLRDNPLIRYVVGMTPKEEAREVAAVAAHREAYALYEDDPERILAAIEAGTHPLQRQPARG